jgi:4-oxalomesaconate tautomerase
MQMRGGTSKGLYFLADELPADAAERDDLLLRVMGSPDPRQIDGVGGAHPLTSKVAVVSPSARPGIDVDYLFLQVMVDKAIVTDKQNCGNILAGIGPFAVERGLVPARAGQTSVRIRMVNTDGIVTAVFPTQGSPTQGGPTQGSPTQGGPAQGSPAQGSPAQGWRPRYDGDTAIDGVPGTAAAIVLDFEGSGAGASVFPTGKVTDIFGGIPVTCVNNGMPVVVAAAASFGVTGYESLPELEGDEELNRRVQELRLEAGKAMGLGDVSGTTVPKVSLVAPPAHGGTISTRTFIPVRVHESIGVLGAVSVGTAIMIPGAVGHDLAAGDHDLAAGDHGSRLSVEHPSGALAVEVELDTSVTPPKVIRSGVVRTARKLFDGTVFPR